MSPVPVQMSVGVTPVPVQTWVGVSPVPVQMWLRVSPVPVQMWAGVSPVPVQGVRQENGSRDEFERVFQARVCSGAVACACLLCRLRSDYFAGGVIVLALRFKRADAPSPCRTRTRFRFRGFSRGVLFSAGLVCLFARTGSISAGRTCGRVRRKWTRTTTRW
jgi:hypothetical protein